MSVISGKAYWAHVVVPNKKWDSDGVWSIDVYDMDEKSLAILKEDGLTLRNKGDARGDFIHLKSNVRNEKTGQLNKAPDLLDAQKRPMIDTDVRVGHGSTVNVRYKPYSWDNQFGKGRGAELKATQVIELIPFIGDNDDEDFEVVADGYSADSTDEDISLAS